MGYRAFKTGLAMGASGNPFIGAMQTGVAMEQYRAQKRDTEWQKMSGNVARLETDYRKLLDKNPGMTSAQAWAHPSIAPKAARLMSHRYIQQQLLEGRDDLDPRKGVELRGSQDSAQGILVGYRKDTGEEVPLTRGKSAAPGDPILQFTAQQGIEFIKEEVANATGSPTALNVTDVYEKMAGGGTGDLSYAASNNPANTSATPQSMGTLPAPPGMQAQPEVAQPAAPEAEPTTTAAITASEQRAAGVPSSTDWILRDKGQSEADAANKRAIMETGPQGSGANFNVPTPPRAEAERALAEKAAGPGLTMGEAHEQELSGMANQFNQSTNPEEQRTIRKDMNIKINDYVQKETEIAATVNEDIRKASTNDPEVNAKNITPEQASAVVSEAGRRPDFYQNTNRGRAAIAATMRHLNMLGPDSATSALAAINYAKYGSIDKPMTALEYETQVIDNKVKWMEAENKRRKMLQDLSTQVITNQKDAMELQIKAREVAEITLDPLMSQFYPGYDEEDIKARKDSTWLTMTRNNSELDAILTGAGYKRGGFAENNEWDNAKMSLSILYDNFMRDNKGVADRTSMSLSEVLAKGGNVTKWYDWFGFDDDWSEKTFKNLQLPVHQLRRLMAAAETNIYALKDLEQNDPLLREIQTTTANLRDKVEAGR